MPRRPTTLPAGVDKAQAADVHAATALSGAKQAVAAKTQILSDAQAKAKAAEDELATANKAFERFAGAQKAVDDAKAAYDAAVAGVADAQKQLEAANEAVVDANFEIVKAKAELASDEHSRPILRLSTIRHPLPRTRRATRSWLS